MSEYPFTEEDVQNEIKEIVESRNINPNDIDDHALSELEDEAVDNLVHNL